MHKAKAILTIVASLVHIDHQYQNPTNIVLKSVTKLYHILEEVTT